MGSELAALLSRRQPMDERTTSSQFTSNAVAKSRPKDELKLEPHWAGRVPHVKPGKYADGLPLHQVEYLSCKLILRPNRFTSRRSLFKFAKVLRAPADQCGVEFSTEDFVDAPLKIREVRGFSLWGARDRLQIQAPGYPDSGRDRRTASYPW